MSIYLALLALWHTLIFTPSPQMLQGIVHGNSSSGLTTFVTGVTFGTPRSDFDGWVGIEITTGGSPLTVQALGRYCATGNAKTHVLTLNSASTTLATFTVDMASCSVGTFVYGTVSASLSASTAYWITSRETNVSSPDSWGDDDTTVTHTGIVTLNGSAASASPPPFSPGTHLADPHMYVPVDFKY